jgi:hypothetical protein
MMSMKRKTVQSSVIRSVGYIPGNTVLEIEFQSGLVYRYHQVPEKIYQRLMRSDSLGKYFNFHIRDVYEAEQVR